MSENSPSADVSSATSVVDDLRSYYESESRLRVRLDRVPSERRVAVREAFVARLTVEGRRSVIDFGAGPATDGMAFAEAGLTYLGIDLAHGNGRLARERGLTVIQGSMAEPPVRARSIEAGWSMSALMHVPDPAVAATVAAMVATLTPGAPLVVGLWGGDRAERIDTTIDGERRYFGFRSMAANAELLGAAAAVESADRWRSGPDHDEYQVFRLRAPDR